MAAAHAHAAAAHAAAAAAGGSGAAAAWDGIWQQQQQLPRPQSTGWADEFAVQRQQQAGPGGWVQEFAQQQQQAGGTASEWVQGFSQEQEEAAASRHGRTAAAADAQATSSRLVAALSADADPKMRNSKFLQFLSKMSKGELMFEDNKVGVALCLCVGAGGWCRG
jgi:peroxin-5